MDNERRGAEILREAAALPPEERKAYLDEVCSGNRELRARLELRLEELGDGPSSLAADEARGLGGAEDRFEKPGDRIGRYRLVRLLGEGGFATVFLAQQEKPIARQVAVKIIKPGMETREIVARFEAERQSLAQMEHSGIAKVFDAGLTPAERPTS